MIKTKKKEVPTQILDGFRFSLRPNGYFAMTSGNRMLMHRYVWQKHNGPIPPDHDIHHIDHNKANNSIDNLECLTRSEHTRRYSEFKNGYGTPKPVYMFDLTGRFIMEFPRASFAAKHLGCTTRNVCLACCGKVKICKGYLVSYSPNLKKT